MREPTRERPAPLEATVVTSDGFMAVLDRESLELVLDYADAEARRRVAGGVDVLDALGVSASVLRVRNGLRQQGEF